MSTMSTTAFEAAYLQRVAHDTFAAAFNDARMDDARIAEATSEFVDDEHPETFYYLAADGMSGFCVGQDGELRYVFSRVSGRGHAIVQAAVDRGASHLDCFDGYLTRLYASHGFMVVKREGNWTPGGPDVVWMEHPQRWQ